MRKGGVTAFVESPPQVGPLQIDGPVSQPSSAIESPMFAAWIAQRRCERRRFESRMHRIAGLRVRPLKCEQIALSAGSLLCAQARRAPASARAAVPWP